MFGFQQKNFETCNGTGSVIYTKGKKQTLETVSEGVLDVGFNRHRHVQRTKGTMSKELKEGIITTFHR